MEGWQKEIFERIASMERSVQYIEDNMKNLPQPLQCAEELKEVRQRLDDLEDFKSEMLKRIAWVSGAFAVVASGIFQFLDQIKAFFKTQ
jgi:hypothetical protein